jgi:hypothetical protein
MFVRITDALRTIVVSLETTACFVIAALLAISPEFFATVGGAIKVSEKVWEYVPVIPLAIFPWSALEAKAVLFPAAPSQNRKLRDWPHYWRLKLRVLIALLWAGIAALCAIYVWMFRTDLTASTIGAGFLGALAVSLITAVSLWLAAVRVKEIVER